MVHSYASPQPGKSPQASGEEVLDELISALKLIETKSISEGKIIVDFSHEIHQDESFYKGSLIVILRHRTTEH